MSRRSVSIRWPLVVALLVSCRSPPTANRPDGSAGTGGGGPVAEICGNGTDDDGNGTTDCADPACFSDPGCPACGDGFRDQREICDGTDLNGDSCQARHYDGGVLRCSSTCQIDDSDCRYKENCSTPGDEDGNGDADCADVACAATGPCLQLQLVSITQPAFTEDSGVVSLRLLDGKGRPVPNQPADITAFPGVIASDPKQVTDSEGQVSFPLRFGRLPVSGSLQVTMTVVGTSLPVPLQVIDPPDLTVQVVVNRDMVAGGDDQGLALDAHVGPISSLQVGSDGTLYLGEACRILQVAPDGTLSRLAGTPTCDKSPTETAADDAAPVEANLSVGDLALSEAASLLYFSDVNGGRVRVLDLVKGTMRTVAGGGLKRGLGAEGAPALDTDIRPGSLALGPDGTVYAADGRAEKIWRVDLQRSLLSTYRNSASPSAAACGGDVALFDCADGCDPFFDAAGHAFVAGNVCGLLPGATGNDKAGTPGVVRIDTEATTPNAGLVHVLGQKGGPPMTSGGVATALAFSALSHPSFDVGGNLAVASGNTIFLIDGVTSRVAVLPGSFLKPSAVAFGPNGDLYVADKGHASVARIIRAGRSQPTAAVVKTGAGNGQQALIAQRLQQPLGVVAQDPTGAPLAGEKLQVVASDPGSTIYPSLPTDASGVTLVPVRLGLAVGKHSVDVYLSGLHGPAGTPAHFDLNTGAPAAGTILTAVNTDGGSAGGPAPGFSMPAATAQIAVNDVVGSSDGSLYLASTCQVFHLLTDGTLELVAGTGSCSSLGDGGPAIAASLVSSSVALDEKSHTLYVAGASSPLVRAIDLSTGIIRAFAGNVGSAGGSGDGGPAVRAGFYQPSDLAVDSSGTVYVSDFLDSTVRQIDAAGLISTTAHWQWPCSSPADEGQLGAAPTALAASGTSIYAGGWVCHGGVPMEGILRADADGSRHFVATLPHVSALAVTAKGTLLAGNDGRAIAKGSSVFQVDPTSGSLTLVAGNASAMAPGDYFRATAAGIPVVHGMASVNGHLYLADGSLRLVW